MDNNNIIKQLRKQLIQHSDPQVAKSGQRFFKQSVKMHGVKSATIEKIGKEIFQQIKTWTKDQIFEVCEKLLQSGYMEESFIACHRSYCLAKHYTPEDMTTFEHRVHTYVNNRATCDTLCNHTIGTCIEKFPACITTLKTWTKSPNRWAKRAAAVSLIIPAKKGLFLSDIIEIANILLLDSDDMVQKGYGRMLKAASQAHQNKIYTYVLSKKSCMPRTALRYAIEKMPKEMKQEAMKKPQ